MPCWMGPGRIDCRTIRGNPCWHCSSGEQDSIRWWRSAGRCSTSACYTEMRRNRRTPSRPVNAEMLVDLALLVLPWPALHARTIDRIHHPLDRD